MIALRPSDERGHLLHGWLDTHHTFSFGDYHDPEHMGFRVLRVMNEDRIAPGMGFGAHGHRDMEILTYVLAGELSHRDSLGNGSTLRPGEFQVMTAGTGIRHSEFNASQAAPVHLYQVWVEPGREGLPPSYDQKAFPAEGRRGRWQVVASPDGRDGSLTIRQDAVVRLASLDGTGPTRHELRPGRHAWLQVLRGSAQLNETTLTAGDGAAVSDESILVVSAIGTAEVLLFDLP